MKQQALSSSQESIDGCEDVNEQGDARARESQAWTLFSSATMVHALC